jgi:hypothetical protein
VTDTDERARAFLQKWRSNSFACTSWPMETINLMADFAKSEVAVARRACLEEACKEMCRGCAEGLPLNMAFFISHTDEAAGGIMACYAAPIRRKFAEELR